LPLSVGISQPPSITWLLGPIRVCPPNHISIGSAVFAGLTNVTNRQTHRPHYSIYSNKPHLPVAAMKPNNINNNAINQQTSINSF